MSVAHAGVARVTSALTAAGQEAEVRHLDESTRTAPEAAAALGVGVAQIAKTLVFLADDRAVVVVMGGADRVDESRLSHELGGATIGRADADAVRAATGFAIGGVSPAGLPDTVPVLVDRGLAAHDEVWAAAGHPKAVYATSFDGIMAITGGRAVDVAG